MRKSPINQAADTSSDIDLTPMLDVVFIMLIFFIVTASFIREAGIDINRPDTNTAEQQKSVSILVAVSASNEIWIDRRRIDVRSIRANIERLRAENPKGAVIVQADNESNTETVARVIDGAREAGAVNVILSTLDSSKL